MRPTLKNACTKGVLAAWLVVFPTSIVYAAFYLLLFSAVPLTFPNVLGIATVATVSSALVAVLAVPLYGLPAYLFLQSTNRASAVTMSLAGAMPSVLYWSLFAAPLPAFTLALACYGLALSLAFWVSASRAALQSSGHTTAGHSGSLRHLSRRRRVPLTSNVRPKMTVVEPWRRIIEYWRQSGLRIRPGVSMDAIGSFEVKYGVAIPADFLEYLLAVDGSSDGQMDNDLFRFWPLSEVIPVHEELDERDGVVYPDRFAYPDCFVFADHLINSWLYAIKLTPDPNQAAPVYRVTASSHPGEKMSPSFREFMERYASNPSDIL